MYSGRMYSSVFYDPVAKNFKMFYSGCDVDCVITHTGFATSTDGISWTKYVGNPVYNVLKTILGPQLAAGDISIVWSYQGGKWSSVALSGGKLTGTLTAMQDGFGYWILMTAADTLLVGGAVFPTPPALPPSYPLLAGWNLVGFKPQPNIQNETVSQFPASIPGSYDTSSIWVYDNSAQAWIRATGSTWLVPGEAMWNLMTTPTTLRP